MTVEEMVLAEVERRRAERREQMGYRPLSFPGVLRRFVPPVGTSVRDMTPTQLADLLFYVDAGYLRVVLAEEAA